MRTTTGLFTVFGMAGREPPTGLSEMLRLVQDFTPSHVVAAIRESEVVGDKELNIGCRPRAGVATTR